jgi:hypothetical protein
MGGILKILNFRPYVRLLVYIGNYLFSRNVKLKNKARFWRNTRILFRNTRAKNSEKPK